MSGLVIDLFAGGGGASVGLEAALGRPVDLAINHSPTALAVHRANHPATRHLEADIWEVRPGEATGGLPVDVLWASPDCTHFSVAKGNVPRSKGIRSLAWVVVDWARETRPRMIFLYQVVDIGMRMLEPHELLSAQFGRFAAAYDLSAAGTKSEQVLLIGNSVCPEVAEALVRANVHATEDAADGAA